MRMYSMLILLILCLTFISNTLAAENDPIFNNNLEDASSSFSVLSESDDDICNFSVLQYTFPRYSSFSSTAPTKISDSVLFSTESTLPDGITLDPQSGILSGTSNEFGTFSISVQCTMDSESLSFTINLDITQLFCSAEDGFQQTEITQEATSACTDSTNQEGSRTRLCQITEGSQAQWGDIVECPWKAPWNVRYNFQTINLYKYADMTNSLSYNGRVTHCTIDKPLPTGIQLNPTSCLISGRAMSLLDQTVFVITASNENSSTNTTFTMKIEYSKCQATDGYPEMSVGQSYSKTCPLPSDYTGSITRTCVDTGSEVRLDSEVNTCQMIAPSDISYGTYNAVSTYTHILIGITPTYQHIATSWSISPELPEGLLFSSTNGRIYGTTYELLNTTSYTITVSNQDASTTVYLSLTIRKGYCDAEDRWPLTVIGSTASLTCNEPDKYEGSITRSCLEGSVPTWGTITERCSMRRPYSAHYDYTDLVFYKGYNNVTYKPSYGGIVTRWSVEPQLSNGLVLNTTTGEIYGVPLNTMAKTSYKFYAINDIGNTYFTITIQVVNRNQFDHSFTYHRNTNVFWLTLLICYAFICILSLVACIYCDYRRFKYPSKYNKREEDRKKNREERKRMKMLRKKEKEEAKRLQAQIEFSRRNKPMM